MNQFCVNGQRLKTIHCFRKSVPPKIFVRLLNTPLSSYAENQCKSFIRLSVLRVFQNAVKHLRQSFLRKQLMAFSRELLLQKALSQMLECVLNKRLWYWRPILVACLVMTSVFDKMEFITNDFKGKYYHFLKTFLFKE